MKKHLGQSFMVGFAVLLLAGLTGCETCKPGKQGPVGKYSLEINLDESLKNSSVIVDVVGVNPSGLPRWQGYDMSKYWREGDPMRHDADKTVLNFLSGQALSRTIDVKDPVWAKWMSQGVTHVLVLADLPGVPNSRPGAEDARRQIIPLDKCNWPDGTTALKVTVQRSGILVLTPVRTTK